MLPQAIGSSSCGAGTNCGIFRSNILQFLDELNTLTGELTYFYDEVPPDSPLNQAEGMRNAIGFMPPAFRYPLYRAMDEMNFSFADAADEVAELNDSLVILKQLNPAVALSSAGELRYGPESQFSGKYGYTSAKAAGDPFFSYESPLRQTAGQREESSDPGR